MNTDFLKYDAASIRELCRRKLLESGAYTDQIYPGSDISIIIDIFSWTFNVLTYILNSNASDILFSDSEVYENLNKMVKLLSYNPRGYTTSNAEFNISLTNPASTMSGVKTYVIPKYASIVLSKNDTEGNEIRYSFTKDFSFNIINGVLSVPKQKPVLYNGTFTKYTFDETAAGIPFEMFTMTNVGPNEDVKTFIDNDSTHVYVETISEKGVQEFTEVNVVKSLILDASFNDLACELRFNENKELQVKFGDGIHGKRLARGNKVHVIYLKSNGPSGAISDGDFNSSNLEIKIMGFSSKDDLINLAYGGIDSFLRSYSALFSNGYIPVFETNMLLLSNSYASTEPSDYEDVTDIKENAPFSFRTGNRLITSNDFRTYLLNTFRSSLKDVYVCNNNEYCALFYKWLDSFDALDLNIRLKNYEYANACDFNNIYIFMNSAKEEGVTDFDRRQISKACDKLKPLTSNIVPCQGVHSYFIPYVKPKTGNVNLSRIFVAPAEYESHIVVKKGDTYYSDEKIKSNIADIITEYFEENDKFGARFNLADLQQKIFALGYVDSIKTVSINQNDVKNGYYVNYVNGLSFAKFTADLIEMKDFECFTQIIELEKFQYGTLLKPDSIRSLIEIVNENNFALKNTEF